MIITIETIINQRHHDHYHCDHYQPMLSLIKVVTIINQRYHDHYHLFAAILTIKYIKVETIQVIVKLVMVVHYVNLALFHIEFIIPKKEIIPVIHAMTLHLSFSLFL